MTKKKENIAVTSQPLWRSELSFHCTSNFFVANLCHQGPKPNTACGLRKQK